MELLSVKGGHGPLKDYGDASASPTTCFQMGARWQPDSGWDSGLRLLMTEIVNKNMWLWVKPGIPLFCWHVHLAPFWDGWHWPIPVSRTALLVRYFFPTVSCYCTSIFSGLFAGFHHRLLSINVYQSHWSPILKLSNNINVFLTILSQQSIIIITGGWFFGYFPQYLG